MFDGWRDRLSAIAITLFREGRTRPREVCGLLHLPLRADSAALRYWHLPSGAPLLAFRLLI